MDNIELFNLCLLNKEPFVDEYYIKEKLILTELNKKQRKIILINNKLIELIDNYSIYINKDIKKQTLIINEIIHLLKGNYINSSPFVIYWQIYDMSYSIYLKMSIDDKYIFIKNILEKYIMNRHFLYKSHGYTNTILQVNLDAGASRRGGNLGNEKIENILNEYNITNFNLEEIHSFDEMMNKKQFFLLADGNGKILFKSILKNLSLKLKWMNNHQNKFPDCFIKIDNNLFIIEHKHLKEVGGAQYKQMTEIIELIKEKYYNIHFIGFIDGIYMNHFGKKYIEPKLENQRNDIINILNNNKNNYIVNTFGFKRLIEYFL